MGDMTDWYYDQEMDARYEFEEEMEYLMSDEVDLRQLTAASRSPKIMAIRKYPFAPLSYKQRWCLAMWVYNHAS